MSGDDSHFYSLETGEEVGKRLAAIFEGLDEKEVRNVFEELIDGYCEAHYGVSIVSDLRKFKLRENGTCTTLQPIANGRALLISAYGFNIKSQSECKCGRAFLVLDEKSKEDHAKEMEKFG